MTKKLILLSSLALISLGATACQNNQQTSSTSSSQSSVSSKASLPSVNKTSNSSVEESNQSSNSEISQTSSSDQMSSSSASSTRSEQSQDTNKESETNLPGDEGAFPIPSEYQGTWYGYDSEGKEEKITFEGSKIITEEGSTQLRKVNIKKLPDIPSEKQAVAAKDYSRALIVSVDGIQYINVRGYFQGAGDGGYYGAHTEKGQPVIVTAHGAGAWADGVYWKSPELAKQYKDEKFDDLNYQD
ncbi:hypothetical protein FP435_04170 [Lactobacillus sp. PV037]|uniref:hypothetical protein n=1 Tax=unclassified Lactobacillus TaxID=2620435 RepID=UPI00223EAFE7|nr:MULTISPECIES: hypothetical protein [unclassified Lactobacillus]QNQ82198.1 hypothetical protein FP433_03680 [Lactobacillus sp. PV012]QNQ83694.1 hypothetical protein FP435_04170 [Lactobacillus sp. PV037]